MAHRFRQLLLAVVIDENGDEVVLMWPKGPNRIPRVVIGSDDEAEASIRALAPAAAKQIRERIQLVRFTVREDLETFEP